jgi:hypothetical protein
MMKLANEIKDKYPKYEEIDAILLEAREMRAQAMRDGAVNLWSMLRRAVARKPALNTAREA